MAPVQQELVKRPTVRRLVRAAGRVRALVAYDRGRVGPLHEDAKRRQLLRLYEDRGHRVFLESGTYRGDTTAVFVPRAERVVTVEVEPALHAAAAGRFARYSHVEVLLGDALDVLPPAIDPDGPPPLVFLDGHFSGGVTGRGALEEPAVAILERLAERAPRGTTIVVDDLRLFGEHPDFPGLDELVTAARDTFPDAVVGVALDALVVKA